MRHQVQSRRFDRPTDQRLALFRGLVTDLLRYELIKTTEAKAKAIRRLAEKMITLGKSGTFAGASARPRLRLRQGRRGQGLR